MALAPSERRRCHAIAAGTYLAIVLFVLRAVLPDPSHLLPFPAMLRATQWFRSNVLELDRQDQAMVVATVARNAHLLTTAPTELLGEGQCHPMPRSHTLGEHMFGVGLLAALPFAATQDPILSFNAALLLGLWIAALSMYAFAFRFLRHPAPAFVAGLAFLLVPARIANPAHPYVPADLWTPLVLLFLDRVFTHRRVRDGLLLGLFASLQVAESLYPLLVCALYVIPFAAALIARHRRELAGVVVPLAVATVPVLASVAFVLGPYLETRAVWGILGDRASMFLEARELGPFQFHFIGWSVAVLAAIALVDRLRSRRADDPRLALAAGAALVAWCAVGELDLFALRIPSPLVPLRGIVPGLDAVRALRAIASGVDVGAAFLAGFGVLVLIRGRRALPSLAITAVAALAVLALPSYGPLSRATFGRLVRLDAYEARPAAEDVALLRSHAEGALLDVPLPSMSTRIGLNFKAAKMLLLASYSPRPTAACYNSFEAATSAEVARLASLLPDRGAAESLAALGFGTVLLHKDRLVEADGPLKERFDTAGALQRKGETSQLALYRLPLAPPTQQDPTTLVPADPAPLFEIEGPTAELEIPIVNPTALLFRQADPIAPSDLELRWSPAGGPEAPWTRTRALLPLAIPPGDSAPVRIATATPAPGEYRVEVRPADSNDRPLAVADVVVTEPSDERVQP